MRRVPVAIAVLGLALGCSEAPAESGMQPSGAATDSSSATAAAPDPSPAPADPDLLEGNRVAPPDVGDAAPPVLGTTEAGESIDAAALSGKYTFVEFIRSGDW